MKVDKRQVRVESRHLVCSGCKTTIEESTALKVRTERKPDTKNAHKWVVEYQHTGECPKKGSA